MDYQQFISEVEKEVQKGVAGQVKVQAYMALKNNGRERKGLVFVREGMNVSPTIYLEEYYEQFQSGDSLEQIVEKILELYKEVGFRRPCEETHLQAYEKIKPRIVYKLINREKNKELLKDTPYVPFMDLALVCYVLLRWNKHGTATMLIKDQHLKLWGVTKEMVFEAAKENAKRLLPAEFMRMRDVIAEMLELDADVGQKEDFMYVVSNEARSYGAVCILYEGVTEMIGAELGENFYVIPSSVHEMIILPESKAPEKREVEAMVAQMNVTQVEVEEVLSDGVYYYNIKEKRFM